MGNQVLVKKLVSLLTDRSKIRRRVWFGFSAFSIAAITATVLWNGATHIIAPWDVFAQLEGGWRIVSGLVPHTDYYNPIGPLTYLLTALGMRLAGPSVASIAYGNLIFLLVLTPWAWIVASNRLSYSNSFLFAIFILFLLAAVRPLGYEPGTTTYAMIYNRYGWALIAVLFLQLFVPTYTQSERGRIPTSISIGLLLSFLFYCKVSYFGLAVVATALALILRTDLRRSIVYLILSFVLVIATVWLLLGISAVDYISDLSSAGGAQSISHRVSYLKNALRANTWRLCLTGLIWIIVLIIPSENRKYYSWLTDRLYLNVVIALILTTTFILAAGNAPEGNDIPLFFVISLICLHFVARMFRHPNPASTVQAWISYLVIFAVAVPIFFGTLVVKDALSIVHAARWKEYRVSTAPESQRFNAAPLADFIIPHTSEWQTAYWRAKNVPARINEGLSLLRRHVKADSRLFVLAFTDPFSFALQLPPPKGPPLWWDPQFSFSADDFPDPNSIFANVNIVVIPILHDEDDGCCKDTVYRMSKAYGIYLEKFFEERDRSDHWVIMQRRLPGNS